MDTLQERFEKDAKRILSTWLKIDNNREILPVWIEFYFWDENNREDEEACHITDKNYNEFKDKYKRNRYRKHNSGWGGYDINLSNNKCKKEYYSCLLKLCVLHSLKDNSYQILTQTNLKNELGGNFDNERVIKARKKKPIEPKTSLRIGVKKGLINEERAYYTSEHKYKYYYKYKKKGYRIYSKLLKEEFVILK